MTGATYATIIISQATNFKKYDDVSGDASASALAYLGSLREQQERLCYNAFRIVNLSTGLGLTVWTTLAGNATQESKNTEQRIKEFHKTSDRSVGANYFQFGRYLLISSSQPGTQPANLRGHLESDARQYPIGIRNTHQISMLR